MIKIFFVLLAGITSISFAAIFIRFCHDVPAIMIATYRLGLASLILCVIFMVKGGSLKNIQKRDLVLSLIGGVFLALHFMTWISSLKYTSVASSVVLVTTNPIFVGIFSYFILREKQHVALITGIIMCFLGSALIAFGDSGIHAFVFTNKQALFGDALALIGAMMASGYLIAGSLARERLDILTYVTIVFTVSAIVLLSTSLLLGIPFTGYRPASYVYMALLAVVPQLIGHTSINWALRHLKTSMIAISILGEPIGATLLAYLFFCESVSMLQFIGMLLIFAAILIASRKGMKQ
jgi:drug/metabolite transporter (DMT)-like permease